MLLTITTTHRPATDLGYLLHKRPDRVVGETAGYGTPLAATASTVYNAVGQVYQTIDPLGRITQ